MKNLDDWFIANDYNKRCKDSEKIRSIHPYRYPVIIFPAFSHIPKIAKNKYLVSSNTTMGMFMHMLRGLIRLKPEEAIFTFVLTFDNGVREHMIAGSRSFGEIYRDWGHNDGYIYMKYDLENTFG